MPVFDASIRTKFVDGSTDLGGKGWVLKDYIIDVYPNLAPGVKTPALWLWGANNFGQLGDGTTTNRSSPVLSITSQTTWKQVSCGYGFTAAIKTDGTLWLWGQNDDFVFGAGQLGDDTTVPKSSPVQTITGGTNWSRVACGYYHAAAIKTDGTLWTWGFNYYYGRLGDNSVESKSSPVQTITGGTNWSKVSCAGSNTAAIKTDGTLWTWGMNYSGTLGDNTTDHKSSPVQTIAGGTDWSQVACGMTGYTAAIKTDGTLWTWGSNNLGQLGDNTKTDRSSPVQTVTGGTNWKQVACGYNHTAAIKTDGTLWLWGRNGSSLGDGSVINRSSPVQTISRGSTWKQVACGKDHTAAIKIDGTLWTWGDALAGKLGNNSFTNRSSPVQTIMRGTTWKQVSCGSLYTAAIADRNY